MASDLEWLQAGPGMSDTEEIPVHRVTLLLCEQCIDGVGGECHSPGCSLFLNRAPDIPILAARDQIRGSES